MTAPSAGLTQPPTSSSTPSGTTEPAASPATAPAPEFRFGQDAEPWMRGLTPAEVTVKARQLAEITAQALQQHVQPQPVYQPQPQAQPEAINPDDYVTGRTALELGNRMQQQTIQQAQLYAQPAIEMAASANLETVRQQYAEEFAKYAPEIYGHLGQVPKTAWTIDNLRKVVKLALVDHLDELADARAARRPAVDSALRSSGANGAPLPNPPAGPDAQLSDAQRAYLRSHGLSPELVKQESAKMGWSEQKWYERFAKHSVGDAV